MLIQLVITRLLAGLVLATIDVSAWYEMYYEPGSQMADYLAAHEYTMAYESRDDDEWGQHRRRRRPRHPLLVSSYDITNYDSTDYVRDITYQAKKVLQAVTDLFYKLNHRNMDHNNNNFKSMTGVLDSIEAIVRGSFTLLIKLFSFNTLMKEKGVKAGEVEAKKQDQGEIQKQTDNAEKSEELEMPEQIEKAKKLAETDN